MEAIILDIKKPLKSSAKPSIKNDLLKTKDFSSTLESLNKKINNKDTSKNTSKLNGDIKNTISNKDEVLKEGKETNVELSEKEDEKKDYSFAYGNMIDFFNTVVDIEDDSKNNEEIQLDVAANKEPITLGGDSKDILEIDTKDKEVVIENNTFNIPIKEDKSSEETSSMDTELAHESNLTSNSNNSKDNYNNKELKADFKILQNENSEEENVAISTANETNVSYVEQLNEKMEFSSEKNDSSKSSLFEQKQETLEVEKTDKEFNVDDEHFISMDKNGIRFIKDSSIELDKPDTIDRKQVIQQIVEKVKINLADAKNEIRVRLKPEVLGEMTMNIEVVKGAVTAKIMVDNQRTKEIIEGNLIQLKEGIKDTGLEIKTVEVFVGNNSDFDKHSSGQFNLKQNNKRVKLKPQDNKAVMGYGEQPIQGEANNNEAYLVANSLNLFA